MTTIPDPCAGQLHRMTKAGVTPPYQWRCERCNRQFHHAPPSYRVDQVAEFLDRGRQIQKDVDAILAAAPAAAAVEPERRFVAVKSTVMQGKEHVATAKSKTFAKRIANALNKHKPNHEGV